MKSQDAWLALYAASDTSRRTELLRVGLLHTHTRDRLANLSRPTSYALLDFLNIPAKEHYGSGTPSVALYRSLNQLRRAQRADCTRLLSLCLFYTTDVVGQQRDLLLLGTRLLKTLSDLHHLFVHSTEFSASYYAAYDSVSAVVDRATDVTCVPPLPLEQRLATDAVQTLIKFTTDPLKDQ